MIIASYYITFIISFEVGSWFDLDCSVKKCSWVGIQRAERCQRYTKQWLSCLHAKAERTAGPAHSQTCSCWCHELYGWDKSSTTEACWSYGYKYLWAICIPSRLLPYCYSQNDQFTSKTSGFVCSHSDEVHDVPAMEKWISCCTTTCKGLFKVTYQWKFSGHDSTTGTNAKLLG